MTSVVSNRRGQKAYGLFPAKIKDQYVTSLRAYLYGQEITLRELAQKTGINYGTLRNEFSDGLKKQSVRQKIEAALGFSIWPSPESN